ncbi:MAG: sigma 54-interacting transcriptional regulator [Gemmatimonadetes bacterium]|nr:sigma 54-interacting transcriptional regulator [Gemmatimonadota bacterium]
MIESLDRKGTWRTYSLANGLAGVRTEHIAEDSEGCLWIATWDSGVSRFDGDKFETFTEQEGLCSDRVFAIHLDSQKRLWFGTMNGVCWYDGINFHHLEDDGIADRSVLFIYEDNKGRIWFGGISTLGYYEGTAFHDLIPLYLQHYEQPPSPEWTNQCWGITQDMEGHLWFGFDYLIRFDGESFYRYDEKEGFPPDQSSYTVGKDHTGKVWIGRSQRRDGLWCYADGTFQSVEVNLGGELRKIQCDREGRMWFCTSTGVLYWNGDGFGRFTLVDGLPHPVVNAVFQDREYQFWFATWGGGLGLYDAYSISIFDFGTNFPKDDSRISRMLQDRQGDIWIGFSEPFLGPATKSLARFDGEHFEFIGAEQGLDLNSCSAIYEDLDGHLWFGGDNGLFRYDGQAFQKMDIAVGTGEVGVSAIAEGRDGQLIFGQWENGLRKKTEEMFARPLQIVYYRDGQCQTVFEKKEEQFNYISALVARRDREFWFSVSTYNPFGSGKGIGRWHIEDGISFYTVADGLLDNQITDLLEDRHGNLWIATQRGLSCFDGVVFRNFTTEDGLPCNRIHCLFEDSRGHLWLSMDGGVAHYDGQLFQTIKSPHIGSVLQILEDHDGNFWFGTAGEAIIRYRPRQTPPTVRLLQVVADKVYENLEERVLSTTEQSVIFEYKGLSFSTHPRDLLYVYRLKGYDHDWQPAIREMRVYYRDLPPGDYTFQVRAVDRDLNYSEMTQVQLVVEMDPRISALTSALNSTDGVGKEFIGQSKAMHQFQIKLMEVASTDITMLILGETGVGKGLAARVLHALSPHSDGPFIQVNCGALPETLIDSELFGHEKGAFTSAVSRKLGKVELAKGGTLFLDEIGDMAPKTQTRMLRLLEERTFERVGGNEILRVQARIVAATNRDLQEMVSAGTFREDLYYRFQVFPIILPPLRERKEDIPRLAEFFKTRIATHLGKQVGALTPDVIEGLQTYYWPGNVRELEHIIQRAVIVCRGSQIEVRDLGLYGSHIAPDNEDNASPVSQDPKVVPLEEFERRYLIEVLQDTNWRVKGAKGAAILLGLPPSTLYSKMKKLGIERPGL